MKNFSMASYPRKFLLTSTLDSDGNNEACYMCFVCPDYCTKIILSPSPLFSPPHKNEMSPILIIMLCILGATFLFFSYVVARCQYSGTRNSRRRNSPHLGNNNFIDDPMHENQGSLVSHPSWFIRTIGLPRSTIDSIGVVRYKRGEVLIFELGRDCSICLSEFQEDESIRVLSKCGHAFHVPCIDTWLMSHTNCPVCRAPVLLLIDDTNDISETISRNSAGYMGETQQESELLEVERNENIEDIDVLAEDVGVKTDIRRSVSVDFSSIQKQQLVPMKRSSSFTGNNSLTKSIL